MTTENFAEKFLKNVSDTMKMFQDSTKEMMEAQNKQVTLTTEICTKAAKAITEQMETSLAENQKLWTKWTSAYTASAKEKETKTGNGLYTKHFNGQDHHTKHETTKHSN